MTTYTGICVGGPIDRSRVASTSTLYRTPIMPKLTMYAEDAKLSEIPSIVLHEYRHAQSSCPSFPDVWLHESIELGDFGKALYDFS